MSDYCPLCGQVVCHWAGCTLTPPPHRTREEQAALYAEYRKKDEK